MLKKLAKSCHKFRCRLFGEPAPVVAVIRLYGVIAPGQRFRQSINMASVAGLLDEAFAMSRVSAVALLINSPGGSPVQSAMITKRIRDLAQEKDVPVLAFAEDVMASGGYMLGLAGDEIYVDASSLVGSIGVVSSGFGFVDAIAKLGIERRLYTAGESKAMLDSFQEEKQEDVEKLRAIQDELHENFKGLVRSRRGKRLKGLRGRIFSGEVFSGTEAVKLGLVDDIGDLRSVLRDRFGDKVRMKVLGDKKSRLGSLLGFGRNTESLSPLGHIADGLVASVEERLYWNRFGL